MGSDEETLKKLDEAAAHLQSALDNQSPEATRLIATYDQLRAACRDDPDARERVVLVFMEQGSTREEAEEWIDRREV